MRTVAEKILRSTHAVKNRLYVVDLTMNRQSEFIIQFDGELREPHFDISCEFGCFSGAWRGVEPQNALSGSCTLSGSCVFCPSFIHSLLNQINDVLYQQNTLECCILTYAHTYVLNNIKSRIENRRPYDDATVLSIIVKMYVHTKWMSKKPYNIERVMDKKQHTDMKKRMWTNEKSCMTSVENLKSKCILSYTPWQVVLWLTVHKY